MIPMVEVDPVRGFEVRKESREYSVGSHVGVGLPEKDSV